MSRIGLMTHELQGEERRITLRLLSYWERKRKGRAMPCENEINPADIADLWEYCFLVHTRDLHVEGLQFTYLGKAIEEIYRSGLSDDDSRGTIFPHVEELAAGYNEVINEVKPHISEGELINPHGDRLLYRQVLLPLGEAGKVDAIFGGLRFLRVVSYS